MANIIIPGRSHGTPSGPVRLRLGHPLAKGLAVFVPLNGMRPYRNLVSGALPDAGTAPTGALIQAARYPGRLGGQRIGTPFSSNSIRFPLPIAQGWPWTMAFGAISNTSSGGWKASGCVGSVCSATNAHHVYFSSSKILRFQSYTSPTLAAFGGVAQSNYRDTIRMAARIRSATDRAFCIDHSQMITDTSNSNAAADHTHFSIGTRFPTAGTDYYGDALEYAMLWSRGLSDDEMREVTLAPWQLVTRDTRRVWFVPAAGGGSTADLAGTPSLTFSQTGVVTGKAALSKTETLTFSQTGVVTGKAALSKTETLTFSDTAILRLPVALSVSFSQALANKMEFSDTANLVLRSLASLSGTPSLTFSQTGVVTGRAALSKTETLTFSQTGVVTGKAALPTSTANLVFSHTANVTFAGSGDLSALSSITVSHTANLGGKWGLSTLAYIDFSHTAVLSTGSAALNALTNLAFSGSPSLGLRAGVSGSAALQFTQDADLNTGQMGVLNPYIVVYMWKRTS